MKDGRRIDHADELSRRLWSEFHYSLGDYLGDAIGWALGMLDIDSIETCRHCGEPIALIEIKHEYENRRIWRATRTVARRSHLRGHLVVIRTDDEKETITAFSVYSDGGAPQVFTPSEMAQWLLDLRAEHAGYCRQMLQTIEAFYQGETA